MNRAYMIVLLSLSLLVLPACGKHSRMGYQRHGGMEHAVERASQQVSALIQKSVQDADKAKQAEALLGEILAEVKASRQRNRQFHQQLYGLNSSYAAKPEAFLQILDDMNARRMKSASKILRLRFDIKELMTEQEWKAFTGGMAEMREGYRHPHAEEGKSKK